ncbi:FG-GAP-like repeat-containing protein [Aliiglaciecola litoralis]
MKFAFSLLLIVCSLSVFAAEYEVTNANVRLYSDKVQVNGGRIYSDDGTIYATASMSGSNVIVTVTTANGSRWNYTTHFSVYKSNFDVSNIVATSSDLIGRSSRNVSFTAEQGSFYVLLQTVNESGTQNFAFSINETIDVRQLNPQANSYSPVSANLEQGFTLTVNGSNLPNSIVANIEGSQSLCNTISTSSNRATFYCVAEVAGSQRVYVKTRAGGDIITGSHNWQMVINDNAPSANSYSPVSANKNQAFTLTVNGSNLPNSIAANIEGSQSLCSVNSTSASRATFNCVAEVAGSQRVYVKTRAGGEIISGSHSWQMVINDTVPSANSYSPVSANKNQAFTLTVNGNNLPSSIAANIEGSQSLCSVNSTSSSRATFNCVAEVAGSQRVYVKTRAGGDIISGSDNWQMVINDTVPSANSYSPVSATQNQTFTLTVNGNNLPNSIVANIEGSQSLCSVNSTSSSRATFNCVAEVAGSQRVYVKTQAGGDIISGTSLWEMTITEGEVGPSVNSFSPANAIKNQSFTLTVNGNNLPGTIVANIEGSQSLCSINSTSSSQTSFNCVAEVAGSQRVYVKTQAGGDIISGSSSWEIIITDSEEGAFVSSFSPASAVINQAFILTVNGTNLPDSMVANIEGTQGLCSVNSISSNRAIFSCIAEVAGSQRVYLKTQVGGEIISGSSNWHVTITQSENEEGLESLISFISANQPLFSNIVSAANIDTGLSRAEATAALDVFLSNTVVDFKIDTSTLVNTFADVPNDEWYLPSLLRLAYYHGIRTQTVITKENSNFRPFDKVSRQEFISMVIKGLNLPIVEGTAYIQDFSDFNTESVWASWAKPYFNTAVKHGLVVGNDNFLHPAQALTIRESLLILNRAKHAFDGNYLHGGIGFYDRDSVDGAMHLQKRIGESYLPEYYESDLDGIDITNIEQSVISGATALAECGVSTTVVKLTAAATFAADVRVSPYYWWQADKGYFKQHSSDTAFETVCFFPSESLTDNYHITAYGGDNIGYADEYSITVNGRLFNYQSNDTDEVIFSEITLNNSPTTMRASKSFSLDFALNQVTKAGVNYGLENVDVVMRAQNGIAVPVYSGHTINNKVTFTAPVIESIYGQSVNLLITARAGEISRTTTISATYLPVFTIQGRVYNTDTDLPVSRVFLNDTVISVDEDGSFYHEFDFTQASNQITIAAESFQLTNQFEPVISALSFDKPNHYILLVGVNNDNDSDGIANDADPDDDNDGMPDTFEDTYGLSAFDAGDASLDSDNDGLSNLDEFNAGSDPTNPDTDGDGFNDGEDLEPANASPIRINQWQLLSEHDGIARFSGWYEPNLAAPMITENGLHWFMGNLFDRGSSVSDSVLSFSTDGFEETPTQGKNIAFKGNAIVSYQGRLLSYGGSSNNINFAANDLIEFDPVTKSTIRLTAAPLARTHAQSVEFNGKMYVFGGFGFDTENKAIFGIDDDGFVFTNLQEQATWRTEIQVYDIASDTWSVAGETPDLPSLSDAQRIGSTVYFSQRIDMPTPSESINTYDLTTKTWGEILLPSAFYNAQMTSVGHLLIFAGNLGHPNWIPETWQSYVYDTQTREWYQGPRMDVVADSLHHFALAGDKDTLYLITDAKTFEQQSGGKIYQMTFEVDGVNNAGYQQRSFADTNLTTLDNNDKLYINEQLALVNLIPQRETDYDLVLAGSGSFEQKQALKRLTQAIYSQVEDDYEFVFLIFNEDEYIGWPAPYGYHTPVQNDVTGIGQGVFDFSAEYGSAGKLESIVVLSTKDDLIFGPSLHEMGHRWGNYLSSPLESMRQRDWLGWEDSQRYHWGYVSSGGQLGGWSDFYIAHSLPQANEYWLTDAREGLVGFSGQGPGDNSIPYSPLELYLMGFNSQNEVPDILEPAQMPIATQINGIFELDSFNTVTMDQIVASNGQRNPQSGSTQRSLNALFVVVSKEVLTDEEWHNHTHLVNNFTRQGNDDYLRLNNFWEATQGKAKLSDARLLDSLKERSNDIDQDGVSNSEDAFPLDPAESVDTDSDRIGNNADTDDDNDGVLDGDDAYPLDPNRSTFDSFNVKHDTNGDDNADILWRNTSTGQNWLWTMNGRSIVRSAGINVIADQAWQIVGRGDFDGDGKSDILWRNGNTGRNYIYLMDGFNIKQHGQLNYVVDSNWKVAEVADFDDDGKDDILWRHAVSGDTWMYLMDGMSARVSQANLKVADLNWEIVASGDVNGDDKADVIWRHKTRGDNYIWLMNGTTITNRYVLNKVASSDWTIAGAGDLNGDGTDDIIWRNQRDGRNWAYLMNGGQIQTSAMINSVANTNWQIADISDLNGDGKADLFWRQAQSGQSYIYLMNGMSIDSPGYSTTVNPVWQVIQ